MSKAKTRKGPKNTKGCKAVVGSNLILVKTGKKLAVTRCKATAKKMVDACWKSVKGTKKSITCTSYVLKAGRTGKVRKTRKGKR